MLLLFLNLFCVCSYSCSRVSACTFDRFRIPHPTPLACGRVSPPHPTHGQLRHTGNGFGVGGGWVGYTHIYPCRQPK